MTNSCNPATPSAARALEKSAFLEGARVSAGTMPGIFAWGLVTGMAMVKTGLTVWQALGMTLIVFAGSAQLAALPLIAIGAPVWVVFSTALMVNLRFVIFSAVVGPHFAHLPWYRRLWYGYLNADITTAFFPQKFPASTVDRPAGKTGFFSGIAYQNWLTWQSGSIIGIFLGAQIPDAWGIGFAGSLALMAVVLPMVVSHAALAGVLVSGSVAVMAYGLPYRLGILLAMVCGMAVAMAVDTWGEREISRDARNEGAP